MKTRTTLYADDGMILTNGEEYGRIIHLAVGADPSMYYEITEEEYKAAMAKAEESALQ